MKLKITVLLVALSSSVFAQPDSTSTADTSWKCGGQGALNFNQASYNNWAAGGENSVSGAAYLTLFANYVKDRWAWENQLDLGYGMQKSGNHNNTRKNEDKIEFNSKLGHQIAPKSKFYATFLFNFKSQFADGFNYDLDPEGDSAVSHFLAPGYFLYSLGIDYKPNDAFSVYISPIACRTLVVNDQELANAGAYGVEDSNKTLFQLGAFLRAQYKKDVMKNVNLQTKLELFSNYLKNPQNIAVDFQILIAMKVNKYLTANLGTQFIYDDIVNVPLLNDISGVKELSGYGPRLQIKEIFGIGLSAKF
jgi:hypothetical protein